MRKNRSPSFFKNLLPIPSDGGENRAAIRQRRDEFARNRFADDTVLLQRDDDCSGIRIERGSDPAGTRAVKGDMLRGTLLGDESF